ncbi:MAG TPA: potassium channel family protein, partial [Candidatus Elarobacter sp.]
EFGIAGTSVREAQLRLRGRIVAVHGSPRIPPDHVFGADDEVVAFARLEHLEATSGTRQMIRVERRHRHLTRLRYAIFKRIGRVRTIDPILQRVIGATLAMFLFAVVYFSLTLRRDPFTAAYFVVTTMTTTGYGDILPSAHGWPAMLIATLLMITGVAASGIFIAFVTSALTRAQFTLTQGLRQIRTRGHVIVCGAGNVGINVVEYMLALGQKVVVVDSNPSAGLIEASRTRRIELLTGDATSDTTLNLCNITNARAIVATADSDTANLEVALGARARNPTIAVVMRVLDETFARSIARHFEAIHTFSTASLAAPAFAMLSRFPGTRGRIAFGDDTYNVGERLQGEVPQPPPAEDCIPLAVWRKGAFLHIDDFAEMEPYDRLLFLVPLSQFKPPAQPRREAAAAALP